VATPGGPYGEAGEAEATGEAEAAEPAGLAVGASVKLETADGLGTDDPHAATKIATARS
jgi:hypothetical protein